MESETQKELLKIIMSHPGQFFSEEVLARKLAISKEYLASQVKFLIGQGVGIEFSLGNGYCWPAQLNDLSSVTMEILSQAGLGHSFIFLETVGSTNELAKSMAIKGCQEGTVIAALTQSAGKGRQGQNWESPEGGLWFSIILRPEKTVSQLAGLSLVIGLCMARVLSEWLPEIRVKWPNDVLFKGKKIAGILLETGAGFDKIGYVVVGIGVNVNNRIQELTPALRDKVSSMAEYSGQIYSLNLLLSKMLNILQEDYRLFLERGFNPFRDRYQQNCFHTGKTIKVYQGEELLTGTNLGLDKSGGLLVQLEDGIIKTIHTGEVW